MSLALILFIFQIMVGIVQGEKMLVGNSFETVYHPKDGRNIEKGAETTYKYFFCDSRLLEINKCYKQLTITQETKKSYRIVENSSSKSDEANKQWFSSIEDCSSNATATETELLKGGKYTNSPPDNWIFKDVYSYATNESCYSTSDSFLPNLYCSQKECFVRDETKSQQWQLKIGFDGKEIIYIKEFEKATDCTGEYAEYIDYTGRCFVQSNFSFMHVRNPDFVLEAESASVIQLIVATVVTILLII